MWDQKLEREVLARAIKDKSFLAKTVAVLKGREFSDPIYTWVWQTLSSMYLKHRELISPEVMMSRVDKDFNPDGVSQVEDILESLYTYDPPSPSAALDEIRRFVKMASARATADSILDGIDSADMEAAGTALVQGATDFRRVDVIEEPDDWVIGMRERLAEYRAAAQPGYTRTISTFSHTLNHLAFRSGGFPIGKIGEVMGNTNVGKSTFMVGLGYEAIFRSQAVVLHITTEDPKHEIAARYDARHFGIDRLRLMEGRLTEDEYARMEAAANDMSASEMLASSLFIHALPKGHPVSAVGPIMEMVREKQPRRPILLCYDSPYHAVGHTPGAERRHQLREVAEYMDNLTKDPSMELGDVSCWFTHQARRKDAGKRLRAESGAESYDIERIVDFMLGLNEAGDGPDKDGKSIIEANVGKNRIGPLKNAVIYFEADLGKCMFVEREYAVVEDDGDLDEDD